MKVTGCLGFLWGMILQVIVFVFLPVVVIRFVPPSTAQPVYPVWLGVFVYNIVQAILLIVVIKNKTIRAGIIFAAVLVAGFSILIAMIMGLF